MADAVTSQLLINGPRNWAYRFTNVSDGTGESGVTKVNAGSSGPLGVVIAGETIYPGVHLKITKIDFAVAGMALRVQFHATSDEDALVLSGVDHWDFVNLGGIQNPGTAALTGSTGSIDFTTIGQQGGTTDVAPSTYTVVLWGTKGIPQV